MHRFLIVAALVLVVVGCGGSQSPTAPSGPQYPAISGTYRSSTFWQVRVVSVITGQSLTLNCSGSITLAQNGASFSGTFQQGDPCTVTTGSVTQGQVRTDGGISFGIAIPGADPNAFTALTGCVPISGSSLFNGLVSGNTLDANISGVLTCPDGDRISLTLRALGFR